MFNTESIESFKKLYETDWEELEALEIQTKQIQNFYISLLSCMIIIFLNKRLN